MRLLFSTSIGTQEDADWPKVFATSPFISPLALLIFRACSAATFLGHMLAHIGHWWYRGWAYCIYLTNWALMLQTSSECLLFILALRGYRILRTQGARGGGLPKTARVAMVLWSTAAPMSLSVTLLFFLLINPVWNLRPIVYVAFFAHFLNWFLLLIGLFVSRIPFSMRHLGWSLLFAATFIIWTVLHFYLKIGRNEPCVDYAMQDCPIYGEFDWHHPQRTAMTSLAAIAGLMMASGIYSGLVRCRDACDSLSDAQTSNEIELSGLFASRIPWSFKNSIWGLVFLLAYLVWTLIHFFARIGRGGSCELYPDPECPIYDEFDWNMPGITTLIVLATLVIYAVVAGLYTGLFRCRDSCSPAMTVSEVSGKEAETKDEPENGA